MSHVHPTICEKTLKLLHLVILSSKASLDLSLLLAASRRRFSAAVFKLRGHSKWEMKMTPYRHLFGDSVENLSLKELKQLESSLENGISKIRARKIRMY